jgi:hypothetical protein
MRIFDCQSAKAQYPLGAKLPAKPVFCIHQIKVEQRPFTTEPRMHGVLPLFFSVFSFLGGLVKCVTDP